MAVLPLFLKCNVPKTFRHKGPVHTDMEVWPKRPANYKELDDDEKENLDNMMRSETLHKYYLAITHNKNCTNSVALQLQDQLATHCQPARIVQSVWDSRDILPSPSTDRHY